MNVTTRTPPDPATIAVSRLYENQATPVRAALDHIRRELAQCGTPAAQTYDDDGSTGTGTTSPTETAAAQYEWLRNQRTQIHDNIRAAALIAYSNADLCRHILGTRLTHTADRCYSSPQLAGYLVPLDEGGWFDPSCTRAPRSSEGQCDACRKRMERWRERTEQKPLGDERTITHDSDYTIGDDGVAHTRPTRGAA